MGFMQNKVRWEKIDFLNFIELMKFNFVFHPKVVKGYKIPLHMKSWYFQNLK